MIKSEYEEMTTYITKDGSEIRELIHPDHHGPQVKISLAEAVVPPGKTTFLHAHRSFQEIYHVLEGEGIMVLGEERFPIKCRDSILIPQGTPHQVENNGRGDLRILCCCSPPYTHQETELLEEA